LREFEISVETEDSWDVKFFLDESQTYWNKVTNASPKNYSIWLEVMLDCKKHTCWKVLLVKRDEFGNANLT
jgi:hypothetical protein